MHCVGEKLSLVRGIKSLGAFVNATVRRHCYFVFIGFWSISWLILRSSVGNFNLKPLRLRSVLCRYFT